MAALEQLQAGERVRVQGGLNYEKFHGGMEGTIVQNNPDSRNMLVQFDDVGTAGPEPLSVAYRNLEPAPLAGGYRAGHAPASSSSSKPAEPAGPLLEEHGGFSTRQLVELHGLQTEALNGRAARLRRYDVNADRWELELRAASAEDRIKRIKEVNLRVPSRPEVPKGLSVAELKERGNESFKNQELEAAIAYYSAAIELLEDGEGPQPPEAEDPKYLAVLLGNRAQCYINLCREVHGEDRVIGKEARSFAMRANMDSAQAIELDPSNGKNYYRRGCAVLGMAPSASRAKEAIECLEVALAGRASGGKDGVVLPNAMRHEVSNLLDYGKRRLDAYTEVAIPDVEACRENCRQQ